MSTVAKSQLDTMVLATLNGSPAHGYAIIEELRQRSQGVFDLPEGTVYPSLHRMERSGLLVSEWAEVAGRRRRVYRLTDRGRQALVEHRSYWRTHVRAVARVLGEPA